MDRRFRTLLLERSSGSLAINGDDVSRRAGQRPNPSHEAALELGGVEDRKDIAEVIVRGCAVAKRPKPAQKLYLLLAKPGDINERLGSSKHGKQIQQQHFRERIDDLAALSRVRNI